MAWNASGTRVLYHGTSSGHLTRLLSGGSARVSTLLGAHYTDFGQGFYLTTFLHQAKNWANLKCQPWHRPSSSKIAAVVAFRVNWSQLASLKHIAFVTQGSLPPSDYWDFVSNCRTSGTSGSGATHSFDLCYGPVSLWPQTLIIGDADQLSFHSPQGENILNTSPCSVIAQGTLADPFLR